MLFVFLLVLQLGLADVLELLALGLLGDGPVHGADVHLDVGALYPLLSAEKIAQSVDVF